MFYENLRKTTIGAFECIDNNLLNVMLGNASHIYVHITDTCNVACPHCMYSSDKKNTPTQFRDNSLERLIMFLHDAKPIKLTLSGGGEPFEDKIALYEIIKRADCNNIEIDSSGLWADSIQNTASILNELTNIANFYNLSIILRISSDLFHMATKKISIETYTNIVYAWLNSEQKVSLGFRGLVLDNDDTIQQIAARINGSLIMTNSYAGFISVAGSKILVTKNILRFSGRGNKLYSNFKHSTPSVNEYYNEFIGDDVRLGLVVNDAIRGQYTDVNLLATTVDCNGDIHIFAATPPDRRPNIISHDYMESLVFLLQDPIVVFLLTHSLQEFFNIVSTINQSYVEACLKDNDYCLIIEKLLADMRIAALVSVLCLHCLEKEKIIKIKKEKLM